MNDPDHRSLERRTPGRPDRRSVAIGNATATGRRAADFPLFGVRQLRDFELSLSPMRIFDHATLRYLAVNDAALELYGYTRAEFLKLTIKDTRHPDDYSTLDSAISEPTGYLTHRAARRQVKRSGEVFFADIVTQDVRFEGRAARLSLTIDISEQVRMQELLRERDQQRLAHALEQRDALVREVHHRIKNHLQGIAGLLRDKAGASPAAVKTIDAAVAQLQAVAVVYGFQSELAESGVPLSRVLEAICASAEGLGPARITRGFAADGGAVRLAEAEAVPVAVALNELVFNAIEHGVRGSGTPAIEVSLNESAKGADIRIVNRGRLPAPFDYSQGVGTGTGLDLVRTLLGPSGSRLAFKGRDGMVQVQLSLGPPLLAERGDDKRETGAGRRSR